MSETIKHSKIITAVLCVMLAAFMSSLFAESTVDDHKSDKERLDSLESYLPRIEKKVLSTVVFGGSSPISFTGEVRLKGQYHRYIDYPDFLFNDQNRFQVSGGFRLGMIVQPGRNLTLWSRLGFLSKYPGHPVRVIDSSGNYSEVESNHYLNNKPVHIYEDMCAGIALSTKPASFWLKFGNIIWAEASPFTIWKAP